MGTIMKNSSPLRYPAGVVNSLGSPITVLIQSGASSKYSAMPRESLMEG